MSTTTRPFFELTHPVFKEKNGMSITYDILEL